MLLAPGRWRPRMLATIHPTVHRTPHKQNDADPNVTTAKAEKPCLSMRDSVLKTLASERNLGSSHKSSIRAGLRVQ